MANIIHRSKLTNFFFIISIILRLADNTTSDFSFLILAFLCFFGIREIIISLLLTWLFSCLNTGIFPPTYSGNILRYLVILAAFISSFNNLKLRSVIFNKNLYLASIILFIFLLFHSIFISKIPELSILKSISWLLFFILSINCWSNLNEDDLSRLLKNIFFIFTTIVLLSLFFIKSKIGYLKNNEGFQGILNHPQLFGMVMSLFGIFILTSFKKKIFTSFFYFTIFVIVILFLILSESRTAIFAFLGSYIILLISNYFFDKKNRKYTNSLILIIVLAPLLVFISIYSLFILNSIFDIIILDNILTKSGRSDNVESLFEIYSESRGNLVLDSYNNIIKNFWTGIGFGIASDHENMKIYKDVLFDIPFSAPMEKGVFYVAIFEEIGVIGIIILLFFLTICLISIMSSRSNYLPLFSIILLLNFGESTFFSTGGAGGLLLIFFSLSITRKVFIK